MPIYEYRCGDCGFQKEALQKLSDAPLKDCPECGKPSLSKMVTAAGFQLKGSGWYATDFKHGPAAKKDPEKPAANADATPAVKEDGKQEGKQESKQESKQEAKQETKPAKESTAGKSTKPADAPVAKATPASTPAANC